jgi:hypothetical protein
MPLPVVTDLYLARLVWTNANAPRTATINLYFKDQAGGHTGTDVYNAVNTAVTQSMWDFTTSGSSVTKVITTKLDGVAASVDHLTGSPAKWTGGGLGTDIILQGCNVITIRTGFRGRSRRGRVYVPWVSEGEQTNGVLASADVAAVQTAWGTFLAAMVTAGYPMHVCSPLHSDSVQASSVTVQPYVKTQRRRAKR